MGTDLMKEDMGLNELLRTWNIKLVPIEIEGIYVDKISKLFGEPLQSDVKTTLGVLTDFRTFIAQADEKTPFRGEEEDPSSLMGRLYVIRKHSNKVLETAISNKIGLTIT